jgi:hypothetical protein
MKRGGRGLALILIMIVFPSVNALDYMSTSYNDLFTESYITNINDFPDYIFVSFGQGGIGCPIRVVGDAGKVSLYGSLCEITVYAVPKSSFSASQINELKSYFPEYRKIEGWDFEGLRDFVDKMKSGYNNSFVKEYESPKQREEYFESLSGKKVIENLESHHTLIQPMDFTLKEKREYAVDLNQVKEVPDKERTIMHALFYAYIFVPIIALGAMILIIIKKKKIKRKKK